MKVINLFIIVFAVSNVSYATEVRAEGFIKKFFKSSVSQESTASKPLSNNSKRELISSPGTYTRTIKSKAMERQYTLHIPTKYKSHAVNPLVMVLTDHIKDDSYFGLKAKSDKEGFLMVAPVGYSDPNSSSAASWNAGSCCGGAAWSKIDDVGFVQAVVKDVNQQVKVDLNRIFAVGMANGGMMTHRLACEVPELFRGIAAVAGTNSVTAENCKPMKAVSILHIHAKDDKVVPYNGGRSSELKGLEKTKSADFVSAPESIKRWRGHYSCSPATVKTLETPIITCELSGGCAEGARVQFCSIESGGHTWPKSVGVTAKSTKKPSDSFDANDIIWDFFRSL